MEAFAFHALFYKERVRCVWVSGFGTEGWKKNEENSLWFFILSTVFSCEMLYSN